MVLSNKMSLVISSCLHILLAFFLFASFEKTIIIPVDPGEKKEIIDAVMVNKKDLQKEISRLEAIENLKKAQEKKRQETLVKQENEAQERRLKEEALALELKKQNEILKKMAEIQAQNQEKKMKAQQEELKKIQKEKEEALALKKKIDQEKKVDKQKALAEQKQKEIVKEKEAQEQQSQQANLRVKQDQITQYAKMMQNKIHQYWRQPQGMDFSGFTCKIVVKLLPTGEVIDVQVIKSSGSVEFDRSTELAIRKASPLPMPSDPNMASIFRQFTFTFHPEAV